MNAWLAAAAEENAHRMTPAERRLWEVLEPLGFRAQAPIDGYTKNGGVYPYILDFYHVGAKLAVEVDGGYHRKRRGRDRRRDTRLLVQGIETLRVTNQRVMKDLPAVVGEIKGRLSLEGRLV